MELQGLSFIPVEYEIIIPLLIAMFFSTFYELDKENFLWSGIIAMGVWMVMGGIYLIYSNLPVMALIFMGIGILYVVRIMIQLIDVRRLLVNEKKNLG